MIFEFKKAAGFFIEKSTCVSAAKLIILFGLNDINILNNSLSLLISNF